MSSFCNFEAGVTFKEIFIENALSFQSELFELLIERGGFKKLDPKIMALHFYAPIFLMLCQYDGVPEKEDEAVEQVRQHVMQFVDIYCVEESLK